MRKIIVNRKSKNRVNLLFTNIFRVALMLAFSTVGLAENQSPQNSRINDYKPDKALKSNARINPMSRAMELSIPIGGYQGRAGSGLPITFDYSSKVWQIDFLYTWLTDHEEMKTDTQPVYAKTSAAGWWRCQPTGRSDHSAGRPGGFRRCRSTKAPRQSGSDRRSKGFCR